jgi:hypothetical protein
MFCSCNQSKKSIMHAINIEEVKVKMDIISFQWG